MSRLQIRRLERFNFEKVNRSKSGFACKMIKSKRIARLEKLVKKQTHELELQNAMLASHRGVIWSVDCNGIITAFKGQYLKAIGIAPSFVEGEHIDLARQKNSYLDIVRNIEKTIGEGPQEWVSDIGGGVFHSYTMPLHDSKGNVVGVAGIANDHTALFKLQRELEAALEAAKIANRTKTNFLANMSHEIRTPMNSIIGFSELALDGNNTPKTRDYLRKVLENSKWLLQIIDDVLDISKIESGRMELKHIPFDLHELFAACRATIMPAVAEKGLCLHFYTEPSIGKKLIGDPTKLRQALLNLLTNAVKFTQTGIIKLSATVKEITGGSVTVYFEVKDSGIGMTQEQIERVFEPFMQADETTTRKYGGVGLGLPITKNIVELMGGKLAVESKPGAGSAFSFEITFEAIDLQDNFVTGEIAFDASERPLFDGEILICEDNRMNQEVICEHLNRAGLSAVVAWNGKEGLEIVRARVERGKKPFDMIFMDIQMPEMDGLEAAPLIAALGTGTPIVALTANVMANDRMLYRQYGMPDCLGKPFTTQELWRCLLKYLTPIGNRTVARAESGRVDEELHKRLLVDFVIGHRSAFENIEKAMEEGDAKLARRLTHSLKGAAGMIGRVELWEAAHGVEQALAAGEIGLAKEPLYALRPVLLETLSEIDSLLDVLQGKTQPPKALDPPQALELLARLELLLKANNLECLKMTDELRAIEGSKLLIGQIEDFDFMPALETLAGIKQALESQS